MKTYYYKVIKPFNIQIHEISKYHENIRFHLKKMNFNNRVIEYKIGDKILVAFWENDIIIFDRYWCVFPKNEIMDHITFIENFT